MFVFILLCKTNFFKNKSNQETSFKQAFANIEKNPASQKAAWGRAKLVVLGWTGEGKSSLLRSMLNKPFLQQMVSTIGADVLGNVLIDTNKSWEEKNQEKDEFSIMANKAAANFFIESVFRRNE
jgi:GTPase SAR1 family protein